MQIIFFRDGLSDGRYAIMGKEEIEDITGAIDDIWQNKNLKTGIKTNFLIVVSKWQVFNPFYPCASLIIYHILSRHHVRFFSFVCFRLHTAFTSVTLNLSVATTVCVLLFVAASAHGVPS
ncbi:uncharacterized protein F5891DRAFT_1203766 [Suillus fuscotomentosus]|uniref:Piwi domain-containing protein n=1 Tax=Suillus fuscotomentosus TaxID=1912939 RepID=A0AAD4DMN0_9AGAM|nr:uncharacterized protein F5891DRAFT_1203766 [Suillus fuscotomentosus]KAG1882854.1 hypothetical protein F5891DRAFT_1203766 [Suillus fuscotomentosus]